MSKSSIADPALPMEAEKPETAMQVAEQSTAMISMIERVAANPAVDVDKLERLLQMQERVMAHQAKAAFDGAFARMQPDLPEIAERGQIIVKGQVRSKYARLGEDILPAIKPVLARHGFALRHRTEWPEGEQAVIRIVGILSHEHGHSEESAFEAPADKSDFRTDVQSMGSTVSYGRRYTTIDLLNLTLTGADNDGQTAGRPQPPQGYEDHMGALREAAMQGTAALEQIWKSANADLKTYTANHDKDAWNKIKAVAAKAGR